MPSAKTVVVPKRVSRPSSRFTRRRKWTGFILSTVACGTTTRRRLRLGSVSAPLHRDPVPFKHADLVFIESTYGDKEHPSLAETAVAAREAVKAAVEQGGRVLVPVFAVGRSQLLLYLLAGAFKRGTLKPFPIFLDSPMAIRATDIYKSHAELFDTEAIAMRRAGDLSANLRTVKICQKAADSYALARKPGPWMVLAGAAMCTGGRIMHHLQNHLPDPTTLVLMVGYQSRRIGGTGARRRCSRSPNRRSESTSAGHDVPFRRSQRTCQSDLLNWLGTLAASRPRVILTHGEDGPRQALRKRIQERFGLPAEMPSYRETIEF